MPTYSIAELRAALNVAEQHAAANHRNDIKLARRLLSARLQQVYKAYDAAVRNARDGSWLPGALDYDVYEAVMNPARVAYDDGVEQARADFDAAIKAADDACDQAFDDRASIWSAYRALGGIDTSASTMARLRALAGIS